MTTLAPTKTKKSKKQRNDSFDNLIGPYDAKMDTQARERLLSARVSLLINHAFFGNLATRLKLVNADEWCATAATDGRTFYYNSRFIMKLRPREVDFLFGHEVLHVVYDHMGRREHRDPQLWNIADDYCVNADLKKHKVGEFITSVPCLYDSKYEGWTAEQVYDDLYEKADKLSLDDLIDQMLDDHMDDDGSGSGNDDGEADGEGKGRAKGKRPDPMSAEEREQLRQEVKQNILNAARQADAGSLPSNVKRMLDSITDPKMPWRELLQTNLTSTIKNDYSFMRPSRRGWYLDAVLPSQTPGEEVDIVVAIDTSGSISQQQCKNFLGEVKGIMEAFTTYRITVFTFDTDTYNQQEYTSENLENIAEYDVQGGGGTDFDAIFRHLKENDIQPHRLVVFTDGYPFGSWGDSDYCDTTWIIHGDRNPNPPFGTWALYDENN